MRVSMHLRLGIAAAALAGLTLSPGTIGLAASHGQPKPNLYRVEIGLNTFFPTVTINHFVPDKLTIHPGDSVDFVSVQGSEPQTVTFGPILNTPPLFTRADAAEINPQVVRPQGGHTIGDTSSNVFSSGALMSGVAGLPSHYMFRFPSPGTYLYRTLFHPGALGEIDVVAPNRPASPVSPDRSASIVAALKSYVHAQTNAYSEGRVGAFSDTGGVIEVGGGTSDVAGGTGDVSLNEFTPVGKVVKVGSGLSFTLKETSGDPHAVVFGNLSDAELHGTVKLYTGIAPDGGLALNPAYLQPSLPSGTTIMTNTVIPGQKVSSGILYSSSVLYPSPTKSNYSLTFDVPGVIYYYDPFHPGMEGLINVIP